jgi:lipopolysaccharide export system permease protein
VTGAPHADTGSAQPTPPAPCHSARSWRLSFTLLRYIAREFTTILMLCIVVLLAFFLIAAIFDDLEDLLDAAAPVSAILTYFALRLPQHLADAIPISLLLATTFCMARLCRRNEMTALRASGVPILSISIPMWLIAALCAVMQFLIAEWVAPESLRRADQLKHQFEGETAPHRPVHLAYRNRVARRDWLFESFAPGVSRGVLVTQHRDDGSIAWELRAQTASYDGNWTFDTAVIRRFDDAGDSLSGLPEEHACVTAASNYLPALAEDPASIAFVFRLRVPDELGAIEIVDILKNRRDHISEATVSILRTNLYRRIFMPLACILAVILGIPLAMTTERGSAMRGFMIALGIMVFYFVTNEVCMALAKSQAIPPLPAAFLSPAVFLGWGVIALRRTR